MNKDKLLKILEGAIVLAVGILIAIFGLATVLDLYFGILAIAVGAIFGFMSIVLVAKKEPLPFSMVALSCIAITVGVGLVLDGWLSVASFILFIVFAIIGLGGALFFYGIYLLVKGLIVYGIAQLLSGIAMLVVGILYLTVPDFQTAFYICLGIVIAVYGALLIVSAFIDVKKR